MQYNNNIKNATKNELINW